jgi:hypothetical protein
VKDFAFGPTASLRTMVTSRTRIRACWPVLTNGCSLPKVMHSYRRCHNFVAAGSTESIKWCARHFILQELFLLTPPTSLEVGQREARGKQSDG